jgi:hypothetical protein
MVLGWRSGVNGVGSGQVEVERLVVLPLAEVELRVCNVGDVLESRRKR